MLPHQRYKAVRAATQVLCFMWEQAVAGADSHDLPTGRYRRAEEAVSRALDILDPPHDGAQRLAQ